MDLPPALDDIKRDFFNAGIPSFGVAGNFTGHLEQAGEAKDFEGMKVREGAPKALFPTFIPCEKNNLKNTPFFLTDFPFSSEKILYPTGEDKIQIEPECAIIASAKWNEEKLLSLTPLCFASSNDCSIRKEGAKKISEKKNWGSCSKGLSSHLIAIDSFEEGGLLDRYSIASFLLRDGEAYTYGETSSVKSYSYIYKTLVDWLVEKINFQKNEGPAEEISSYLKEAGFPERIMISIGATRYTPFGEKNFLRGGDEAVVVLFPHDKYDEADVKKMLLDGTLSLDEDVSLLRQKIVVEEK